MLDVKFAGRALFVENLEDATKLIVHLGMGVNEVIQVVPS